MDGNIRFDYAEAQNLLEVLGECSRYLDELSHMIHKEVIEAGQWWEGGSYEAFKHKYDDPRGVKAVIASASEKTNDLIRLLNKIIDAKRDFEYISVKKVQISNMFKVVSTYGNGKRNQGRVDSNPRLKERDLAKE